MSRLNNNTIDYGRLQTTKGKLRSIMEAASALTALGDEDEVRNISCTTQNRVNVKHLPVPYEGDDSDDRVDGMDSKCSAKRFLPEHKKQDAAPTFPEKLMSLMKYADTQGKDFCVIWLPDGKSFVIKDPDEFTRNVVPKYFKPTKFSSFTRKLYRWGFRQINRGIGPVDPIIFGNDNFVRDNEKLISKMRSITAAGNRKQDPQPSQSSTGYVGLKRQYESTGFEDNNSRQRLLLDQLLQQKAASLIKQQQHQQQEQQQKASLYESLITDINPLSLTAALRPNVLEQLGSSLQLLHGNATAFDLQRQQLMQHHSLALVNQLNIQNQVLQGIQYPNSQSTAEILNAAFAALRYAN